MYLSPFGVNFAQVKEAAEKGRNVGKRFSDKPGEVSEVSRTATNLFRFSLPLF
jgi:hypothetical protein